MKTQQVALTAQRSKSKENFIRMFFFFHCSRSFSAIKTLFLAETQIRIWIADTFCYNSERQSTICSKSSLHIIILKPFTLECLRASIAIILIYSQLSANPSIEVTLVLLLCWRVSHQQYESFRILSVLKCVFFTLNIKHNGGYGKIMEQLVLCREAREMMSSELELICTVSDRVPSRHHLSPPPSPKLLIPLGVVSTDRDRNDTKVWSKEIRRDAVVESSLSRSDPVTRSVLHIQWIELRVQGFCVCVLGLFKAHLTLCCRKSRHLAVHTVVQSLQWKVKKKCNFY